jgi:glyoxylase-like metal-dependent hydrolase (beta-lactamase superfamily II)
MEIKYIQGNTAYIDAHQLIGLYITDGHHCILLDSGIATARQEIEETLLAAGLTPVGVLATHTHFDHFGNAAYFQKKYHIPVAISFGEAELCRTFPAVKSHLFVYSAGEIMSDPVMSPIPCKVDRVIMPAEDELYFCGVRFEILRTPGHSPEHISIITPDRVCYGGDALLYGHALTNAKLPYAYNFRQSLESIELFRGLPCDYLLLAHRGVIKAPFDDLLDENRSVMEHQLRTVASIIDHQMSVEEIYAAVRETMAIRVNTPRKAQDLERFLRPYLECLLDDGTHRLSVRDTGTLCYEPVSGS